MAYPGDALGFSDAPRSEKHGWQVSSGTTQQLLRWGRLASGQPPALTCPVFTR